MHGVLEALRRLPDLGDPYEDERRAVAALTATDIPPAGVREAARARALRYIDAVRAADTALLSAQNLLNSFPLATPEGIALLRLAEALLRAPDAETQTWLIAEKLAHFRDTRIGLDGNFVTRVLATALKIAGHTSAEAELQDAGADRGSLRAWLAKSALRPLVIDGIRRFGDQFVFATNLPDAMARVKRRPDPRVTYSFDMLGEGARTRADADRSYTSYVDALIVNAQARGRLTTGPCAMGYRSSCPPFTRASKPRRSNGASVSCIRDWSSLHSSRARQTSTSRSTRRSRSGWCFTSQYSSA